MPESPETKTPDDLRPAPPAAGRSFLGRLRLRWETVRRLKASQILARLRREARPTAWRLAGGSLRRRCERLAAAAEPLAEPPERLRALAARRLARGGSADAGGLLAGRFTFLNRTVELGRPVKWSAPEIDGEASRLWKFHLSYFEWALELLRAEKEIGEEQARDRLFSLIDEFIEANPLGPAEALGDYWHPYPVSRRAAAWALVLARAGDDARRAKVLRSLALHLAFLEGHLERDLLANHIIANARGLFLGAALFSGAAAERWRTLGLSILRREIPEQVLPDGGHFERSPMYHVIVLDDLLDCLAVLDPESPAAVMLREATGRMAGFLEGVLHPDGEIPLLNDSADGMAPRAKDVLAAAAALGGERPRAAEGPRALAFPETGCWVARDGARGDYLILACGPLGPEYNPGHAHADLLSFELSHAGRRFIVDTGVAGYAPDESRALARSVAAHNTVRIDGRESCEMWGAFRVGRRGRARLEAHGTGADGILLARAAHDGYARAEGPSPAVVCRRHVAAAPGGFWLLLDDLSASGTRLLAGGFPSFHSPMDLGREETPGTDFALAALAASGGAADFRVESFLHVHPAAEVEREEVPGAPFALAVRRGEASLRLIFFFPDGGTTGETEAALALVEGRCFPAFGIERANRGAVFSARGRGTLRLGLVVVPGGRPDSFRFEWRERGRVATVGLGERERAVELLEPSGNRQIPGEK